MPQRIQIVIGSQVLPAELNDTETARNLHGALPIAGEAHRWGDEIYTSTAVTAAAGDPMRTEMGVGELAFWPSGRAFCIFWGPTPASEGGEPRAVSGVVPIGQVHGPTANLQDVAEGTPIRIEPAG